MKKYVYCIAFVYYNIKNIRIKGFKLNLLTEDICQEVLTLHKLTITLRRNLNPPGFFFDLNQIQQEPEKTLWGGQTG